MYLREIGCAGVADLFAREKEFDTRSSQGWAEVLGDLKGLDANLN